MNVNWRRSSSCEDAACVEIAEIDHGAVRLMRHNQEPGVVLTFTRREWDAFLQGVRAGEFD